ncbi:S-adenosyl-L-methionine-dependent methyltransferase, partial [Suillus paluster]|uniref:S-adenosyl-L-methionine-dependent methyltransferase n=1 Tax=Suillus paluster TaxID=48578 RepID=UPI001B86A459
MIYTSGVITNANEDASSLEELQDNKLCLICSKLDLKPEDHLLNVGCGWGTLATYAAKNHGCDIIGITLSKNQTKFGNECIKTNNITPDKACILCMNCREIPGGPGHFTKIVSLEMAEHVGIRHYGAFMCQMYDLLKDDGIFVLQVAGTHSSWQYEDLI